ncbi:MAG TPA: hypothetical protein DHV25_01420 [Candidatus Kerfeldbacteria bacterium]|nr:MAG: hypothetical protein UY34_C0001G0014 [Parcubacteria group bacterium GW2011_GWA2_48_9]KKW16143.1 MAG: hypothetical protein UY52_C0009G0003 [Parcubacteria group bacterium GW2011_GWC2_49_9]HCJ52363.1 hypothetical protein [Candidatus Kerfeldbacteria bacterium]
MSMSSIATSFRGFIPLFLCSIVIAIGNAAIVFLRVEPSGVPVSLHYNVYYGIDLIGEWWRVYSMAAVGIAIVVLNIAIVLLPRIKQLTRMLVAVLTVACQVVLLASSILVLRINL